MSRRHFSALLVAALVAAVAVALLVPGRTGKDDAGDELLLLEDVAANINDVDRLVFTAGGGVPVSTLERGEESWTISELQDYPADWGKVKKLLTGLAELRVVEIKTSNPEYFSRLGVADISLAGARGTLLEVSFDGQARSLILGDDATARGGQYLRPADQEQSVLVDRSLDASADPLDWADSEIVNIGSAQVAEIEILHPDGDQILISKVSADDPDFTLENLPANREVLSGWTVNSLANVFSMLRMDGVKPDTPLPDSEPVTIRLLTFSGLELKAEVFAVGKENSEEESREAEGWISLLAVVPESVATGDIGRVDGQAAEDFQQAAEEINLRTGGWLYRLPEAKYQSMTRRFAQLLKPLQDQQGADGG